MKTILVTLSFPPSIGGVQTYYAELAKHWPDEFVVIDNKDNKLVNTKLPFLKWLPGFFTILSSVRSARPDWVLVGEILPTGLAAYLASRFTFFPYAVFLHGLDFPLALRSGWKRFLSRRILSNAKLILCANSKTAAEAAHFLGSQEKIHVVNPGIDSHIPEIRPERASGLGVNYGLENNIVLMTLGRLVKRKGVDNVLAALPSVLETIPNIRYVIIGQGPEEAHIKSLLQDPELQGKVALLTDVINDEKWTWLSLADIFIMPAREIGIDYEGFGIVYLEANLLSKPVIAGRSGGVPDAVVDQVTGILIDPENISDIAEAIKKLALDAPLRENLGRQGHDRALKDFAWPDKVKLIYELLSSIKAL